jgi:hypothetical protein
MGIFVAGHTVGLQAEEGCVSAPVGAIVAVLASSRPVSAFERPARLAMIESLLSTTRPADELRIPSEMLDVTATAVLPAILASVEACLLPNLNPQIVVAAKAGVGVDPFARRVTFAAIRIAIDVGVGTGELPRGQKLGAGWARHQRSGNRGHRHQGAHDKQRCNAPPHSEKIQR